LGGVPTSGMSVGSGDLCFAQIFSAIMPGVLTRFSVRVPDKERRFGTAVY
jgi:hypothetical protein